MSMTEIVFILAIGLVILGPEKIPDVAKMLGKAVREIRKASNLLRDAMVIPDEPPRRTQSVATQEPPAFDQVAEFDEFESTDPSPEKNVQVVRMRDRQEPQEPGISEFELTAAQAELMHREVYLHIPYEETI